MKKTLRLGMIGLSPGNGHPFSFSSIINGYSDAGLADCGWDVIYRYVRKRHFSEFGFENAKVTHAWTQSDEITESLCKAALIPNKVKRCEDLLGAVDAVILARDDYENHLDIAKPFLEAGVPMFIDKPLTASANELKYFLPYLERGQLMSCSGFRYARELDDARVELDSYGSIKLIDATVLNSWEKYGVHMLEAVFGLISAPPVSVQSSSANDAEFFRIKLSSGTVVQVNCLGDVPKTFKLDIYGTKKRSSHEIEDNFSMFRRTLAAFVNLLQTGAKPYNYQSTVDIMRVLIAGRISQKEGREVKLEEVFV